MSLYVIEEGNEKDIILEILEHTYSYLEIERRIIEENLAIIDVIILNQYENICFFLVYHHKVTVVSPYIPIKNNKTILAYGMENIVAQCCLNICYITDVKKINYIIKASKVLLINFCNNEKFTIPRLNLSTHVLAGFLRVNTLSRVYIVDMQFDLGNQDVINEIEVVDPDILGLSVNYGFFEKSITFLDELYEIIQKNKSNIHIILGNVIPAINYEYYLERYPYVVVSYAEGEETIKDYTAYVNDIRSMEEVSGIYYYDKKQEKIVKNELKLVNLDNLPFPALDTLLDIKKRCGALSLEFSRGCSHSACTFCPRGHKGRNWRYMGSAHMYELSEKLYKICKKEHMSTRIYVADEEFVGYINGHDENERIVNFFSMLQQNEINLIVDISCRVDSVYACNREDHFNLEKMKMWNFCKKNGLGRVFLGVESFCNKQLIRYNKATTCIQNITAIKILTSLGIDIRLGILLFDQLMTSISEINENVRVLGRTDIVQKKFEGDTKYDKLYSDIICGKSNSANIPLYMKTSYLLTVMEVLKDSDYFRLCKNKGINLMENNNEGRYEASFVNKYVGIISSYLKKWVIMNYPIVYALKTLLKSSDQYEYQALNHILKFYKTINYNLLQYSINYIDDSGLFQGHVVSFLEFSLPDFIEQRKYVVEDIDDFFEKAMFDAKMIFKKELNIFKQKFSNVITKQKLIQLIDEY